MEFLDKTLIYQGETREINSDLETNINHLWPEEEKVTSVLLLHPATHSTENTLKHTRCLNVKVKCKNVNHQIRYFWVGL